MLTKVVATQLRIFANPTKVYKDLQELAWKKGKLAKIYSVCSYCKAVYGEKYSSNLEDDGMLSHGACKPCLTCRHLLGC